MKLLKKNLKILIGIAFLLCVVISWVMYHKISEKALMTSSSIFVNASELSNKKIGWGIKNEGKEIQPDLGAKNKQLIDKYNGIALGSADKKYVYLTFDEGYEAGYTSKILDVLKENDVHAAFFITGYYLNKETDLVKRMLDDGHIVGNHTVNHYSMPTIDDEKLTKEIKDLHTAMYEKTGYEMKYLRPPMGEYSERTLCMTQDLGYTTVMWSFRISRLGSE